MHRVLAALVTREMGNDPDQPLGVVPEPRAVVRHVGRDATRYDGGRHGGRTFALSNAQVRLGPQGGLREQGEKVLAP